jgi:hypothetical protein
MNNRQLEIRERINLPAYLKELSVLAGREVNREEMISLEFTAQLQGKVAAIPSVPSVKFKLQFDVLKLPAFATFIEHLRDLNPLPVYLWTSHTMDCGVFKLTSISEINFGFPFELMPAGIFTITPEDVQDRMVLDFSVQDDGRKILELELYGNHWVNASRSILEKPRTE